MEGVEDTSGSAPTSGGSTAVSAAASAAPPSPSPSPTSDADADSSASSGVAAPPLTIFSTSSLASSSPSSSVRPPSAPSLLACATPPALLRDSSGDSSSSVPETSISFAGDDTTDTLKPGIVRVARACGHCKKAKARCDLKRPCDRCVRTGKEESCVDSVHAKRGRKQGSPLDGLKNPRTELHLSLIPSALPAHGGHFTFHHSAMGFAMGRLTSPTLSPAEPQRSPAQAALLPAAATFMSPPARRFPTPPHPAINSLQLPQPHPHAMASAPQVYTATMAAMAAATSAVQTTATPTQSLPISGTPAQATAASTGSNVSWPFPGPSGGPMLGYGAMPPSSGAAPALVQPMAYGAAYTAQVQQWQRNAFANAASSVAMGTASALAKGQTASPSMPPPAAPHSLQYPPAYGSFMPPTSAMYALNMAGPHPHMPSHPPYPSNQPMYVHQPIPHRQFAATPPFIPSHMHQQPPPQPQQQHQQQQQQQSTSSTLPSMPLMARPPQLNVTSTSGAMPATLAATSAYPTQPQPPSNPAPSPAGTWYIPPRMTGGAQLPHNPPR